MDSVTYTGGIYIKNEKGNFVDVRAAAGNKAFLTNGQRVDVKTATVDAATNGTTELIPAVAAKRLMILFLDLSNGAGAATTVTVKSATTAISQLISLAANQQYRLPFCGIPYYRPSNVNEAINLTLSNGAAVGALAFYIELPIDVDLV